VSGDEVKVSLRIVVCVVLALTGCRSESRKPTRDLTLIGTPCTQGECPGGLQCSGTSSSAHLQRAPTCQVLCNFNEAECPAGWSCNLGEHGPAPDDAGGYCAPRR